MSRTKKTRRLEPIFLFPREHLPERLFIKVIREPELTRKFNIVTVIAMTVFTAYSRSWHGFRTSRLDGSFKSRFNPLSVNFDFPDFFGKFKGIIKCRLTLFYYLVKNKISFRLSLITFLI